MNSSHTLHSLWENLTATTAQLCTLYENHPHHEPHDIVMRCGEQTSGFWLAGVPNVVVLTDNSLAIRQSGAAYFLRLTRDMLDGSLGERISGALKRESDFATRPIQQQYF